jgi:polyferredoxin
MDEKETKRSGVGLRWLRRISQLAFLAIFLVLFRLTDYSGSDEIPHAVNLFFRWDPLVAASVTLATRTLIALLAPALIIVALTAVFGRVFCGWICPMGTLIDASDKLFRAKKNHFPRLRRVKYYLLAGILITSLFGIQLVGLFDPFSILVRGMTVVVDPIFNLVTRGAFDWTYLNAPAWVSGVTEPVYGFLKETVLPFKQSFFTTTLVTALIFFGILFMAKLGKRFWCRNFCPLGALLALLSRFSIWRRFPAGACKNCTHCAAFCRMDAFEPEKGLVMVEECTACQECITDCQNQQPSFRFKLPRNRTAVDLRRRHLLGVSAGALALPALTKIGLGRKKPNPFLLRPPGAAVEDEFQRLCVRCGECMKVCIKNALHPTLTEAGLEGMFTPRMIPRIGYCEFACNLCGQVCPTGAIARLPVEEKKKFVMGLAQFDKSRCIPHAHNRSCIVCEEHCPLDEKAIQARDVQVINQQGETVTIQLPHVVEDRCIGCGICEYVCPLPGDAGIRVFRHQNLEPAMGEGNEGYG